MRPCCTEGFTPRQTHALLSLHPPPLRRPLGDRRPHARGPRHRRPGRGDPNPRQSRRIDHAHRPRSPVHEQGIRPSLQVSRGSAKHERGRLQRGQRTRRVLQRHLQTRDPARTKELAQRARGPTRRLPTAPPLQHPTPTLPPRTTITDRLRGRPPTHTNYAGTSRITRVQNSGSRPVLERCPELDTAAGHVRNFGEILSGHLGARLPAWIDAVDASQLPGLTGFALHLLRDLDAVTAGLTLDWSSGSIEGAVNRIKKIRRQLYGRAGFPLLRKLILLQ